MRGPSGPRYAFREESSFAVARSLLGLPEREIDDHLFAIQDQICDEPLKWTAPVPGHPGHHVAVSSATPHSPVPLQVAFYIDGDTIVFVTVARRRGV